MIPEESLTRGERNNNPGNIRKSSVPWQGQSEDQGDPAFVRFDHPDMGIRALGKVLLTYQRKHGLQTLRQIIERWAPEGENDTNSYLADVCRRMGVSPDESISLSDNGNLRNLTVAIIFHENGRCNYSEDVIQNGVLKALA